MERLTERERNVDGTGVAKEEITDGLLKPFADKILTKLAVYEDLEEQGLLVRLPCEVGDTLYCIDNEIVELLIVNSFRIYNFNRIEIDFENASGFTLCTFSGELDEGYFLTREEAEKKLEELKNEI